ncbi:MAG: hypothetical protein P4L28_12150 [Paludibacteraceae bacterium]|nr:hypothetical protein [Paludibacteraceae bacterium]
MVNITTIGVSTSYTAIQPLNKQAPCMKIVGISLNCGTIPPKNYFHPKIAITGIAYDAAPKAILTYEII